MNNFLKNRKDELFRSSYKPTYLKVDEFTIHKSHSYATCVMDLETGEILYVGKERGMEDFRKFLALHGIVAFPKKNKKIPNFCKLSILHKQTKIKYLLLS